MRQNQCILLAVGSFRDRLAQMLECELGRFVDLHPTSYKRWLHAQNHLLGGVPMPWMTRWAGAFPISFESARGAHFSDVDGIEYVDFCLGDTAAMTGHGLARIADAL